MEHLSAEQYRFYELVSAYPRIAALWDWEEKALHLEAVKLELDVMSSGERALTRFFACLWYGHNQANLVPFDIVSEISSLDAGERTLIAEWVADPFWP
ncbi:hypothetical protein AB9W54_004311 [Salmonella enterica]